MDVEPALIVDAKALYDLLSKPEVQASSGPDKRTTTEVLVRQDKLACCGSKTRWVSSEKQYVDGPTKQSAAQLLAERLRTHLVKLKSDTTFQAAKKKTPQERKKNTEMYALKKPQRALQAMLDYDVRDLLGQQPQHKLHLHRPLPGPAEYALHPDSGDCHRHHGDGRLATLAWSSTTWTSC